MKSMFNRYLGKILAVIKQDGFFAGAKKILEASFFILTPVGKGDILFISSGVVGDSVRYRVRNVAEELRVNGFKCGITVQENPLLATYIDKYAIFVFHRVSFTLNVQKLIEEIKKQGKEIIFETDDLLFDSNLLKEQDFFKNINELEKKFYENGVGGEILSDPYVKACTTTTSFLAEKLREKGKKVFIVPNKLSKEDIKNAEEIVSQKSKVKGQRLIRLGYFSGVHSHNKDFAVITEALIQIMEKNQNVELFLVGPLDLESKLNVFGNRVKQFPYVSREKHFANVASVDINLAPLELDNPFCQSKSELKFFEAAIVGVPTVAISNQTFSEAIEDGVDGFTANGTSQWFEKLERLILDENLRISMGQKAREKALSRYTTINAKNEEYYAYLRGKIGK